jgi:hypothetical protein
VFRIIMHYTHKPRYNLQKLRKMSWMHIRFRNLPLADINWTLKCKIRNSKQNFGVDLLLITCITSIHNHGCISLRTYRNST